MNMLQFQVMLILLSFAKDQLNARQFLRQVDVRASTADGLLNAGECDELFFNMGCFFSSKRTRSE